MSTWLGRVALVFMGLFAALAISEIFIRRTFDIYRCHDALGWTFAPGKTGLKMSAAREFRHRVRINDAGLNDEPRSLEKPEGTFRILILGDSMMAAVQVDREDSFSQKLERELDRLAGAASRIEIVNAGIDGYGTAQALLFLRTLGWRYEPDLVLQSVYLGNDVADNYRYAGDSNHYLAGRCGRPYFELREGRLEAVDGGRVLKHRGGLLDRLLRNSVLYSNFVPPPLEGASGQRFSQTQVFERDPPQGVREAWSLTEALLLGVHREVTGRGARHVVVITPGKPEVGLAVQQGSLAAQEGWDFAGPRERLVEFLGAEDIAHVDLTPSLLDRIRSGDHPYYDVDAHWNETGHAIVSETLRAWLVSHCTSAGLPLAGCGG